MNYKWTENLVRECRNTAITPYAKMSVFARRAIMRLIRDCSTHVEYYSSIGWLPVCEKNREGRAVPVYPPHRVGPCSDKAYRIIPGWNPMAKKSDCTDAMHDAMKRDGYKCCLRCRLDFYKQKGPSK